MKPDGRDLIEDIIRRCWLESRPLRIAGFGEFRVRESTAQRVRDPLSGEWLSVPGKAEPIFEPDPAFCAYVDKSSNAHQIDAEPLLERVRSGRNEIDLCSSMHDWVQEIGAKLRTMPTAPDTVRFGNLGRFSLGALHQPIFKASPNHRADVATHRHADDSEQP